MQISSEIVFYDAKYQNLRPIFAAARENIFGNVVTLRNIGVLCFFTDCTDKKKTTELTFNIAQQIIWNMIVCRLSFLRYFLLFIFLSYIEKQARIRLNIKIPYTIHINCITVTHTEQNFVFDLRYKSSEIFMSETGEILKYYLRTLVVAIL